MHAYNTFWHPAASQVYQVAFWLMKYGSPSPKRLLLRSNWATITQMDLGRLTRTQAAAQTTVKTSCLGPNMQSCISCLHACSMHDRGRHGTDKKKWSGTKALKDTQRIPQSFMICICTHACITCSEMCRVYPPAFGQRLARIWTESNLGEEPLQSLRCAYIACYLHNFYRACMCAGGHLPLFMA